MAPSSCPEKVPLKLAKETFFFGYLFFSNFSSRSLVSADSPGKSYLLFLPLRSIFFKNTRILSEILNVPKQKLTLLGKGKNSYKNNRKDLLNSVFQLVTQSFWQQLVQELIAKLHVLNKVHISVGKELKFQSWENAGVVTFPNYRKSGKRNCSLNQSLGLQKWPLLERKTPYMKNASQWQLLALLSRSKFLYVHCRILLNLYAKYIVGCW